MLSAKLSKWILVALFVFYGFRSAHCVRARLYPDEEPTSAQVYNNYRMLMANPSYYFLKSAGLLNESIIDKYHLEDYREKDGNFARGTFAFNSSEYFRKGSTIHWFAPWEEHAALNTYDDPRDRDLATGPQVDQELCALHLDYMIHLNEKYNRNLSNATELSIFMIMNTYDIPRLGLNHGNTYFLGDYAGCMQRQLNVMKRELEEVNRTAAEQYFRHLAEQQPPQTGSIHKILYAIRQYIGPFFGYLMEPEQLSMYEYRDKIKALPMRYCINKIRWPSWPNTSHHIRNDVLKVGACIPETCDSNSLKLHYDKIRQLAGSQMSDYYSEFYISDLYCLPDSQSELRNLFNYTGTIVFIVFNAIWICLTIIATFMSPRESEQSKRNNKAKSKVLENLLMCWSLRKNIRDFVAAAPSDNAISNGNTGSKELRVDTSPLEGFKVMSSFAVITSHACIIGFTAVSNARAGQDIISRGWLAMTNTICPAVVDNFFVVTGVITAKIVFAMRPKILMKPGFWVKFMLYRYLRIVPLYLFIHWFLQSSFRFLGDGPFWDYGTSHTAWTKLCQEESWWTIILPSANFKSPGVHCNGVGWSLANDLQMMLLSPIVIILLIKKPLIGYLTLVVSIMALVANHIAFFLGAIQDVRSLFEQNLLGITRVLDDTTAGYTFPQYRSPAFLIGLAAGHVLHLYETGVIKEWPKAFITYGKAYMFFIFYLICFMPYISSLVPTNEEQFIKTLAAIRDGTFHSVVSGAIAIFILFLCTNQLHFISKPYSWYIFRPLSNASLCTLLVHIPLLFYFSQSKQTLPELSTYYMVSSTILWAVQSYALAVVVHVLYELPMRRFLVKSLVALTADKKAKVEPESKVKTK